MMTDRPNVSNSNDGNVLYIPLDGEVEMSGIGQLVVDHKTRYALHGLKNCPVSRHSHRRLYKWEPLAWVRGIPALKRFFEIHKRRTLPVLRERRIPQLEVVLDLLECGGVDTTSRADACLAGPAKQLAENPSAETG